MISFILKEKNDLKEKLVPSGMIGIYTNIDRFLSVNI